MRIEFDPTLVEQAVDLAVRADRKLELDFHQEIDPLFALESGRIRETRFREAYAEFFTRLDFGKALDALMGERPVIAREVRRCIVHADLSAKNESAELFVKNAKENGTSDVRTLVLRVAPRSIVEPQISTALMRRELFHIADMVDEKFAYRREELEGLPSRQNLVRDRYRVLWNVYIEGRLAREGKGDAVLERKMKAMFARVFNLPAGGQLEEGFDRVFHAESLTHRQLFEWARTAPDLLSTPADETTSAANPPGGTCPLCSFPTYDWFDFGASPATDLLAAIRQSFPHWTHEQGACRQCAEILGQEASRVRLPTAAVK